MIETYQQFNESLRGAGVDRGFERIGLDFERIMLMPARSGDVRLYGEHSWIVYPHSLPGLTAGIVIHAVPPVAKCEQIPWEEWFVLKGSPYHQILYTAARALCDKKFVGNSDDIDHPKAVLGKTWYYYNTSDLTPFLFQKAAND
ncbi:MAG TPA: hypothetical protein VMV04_17370 [Thermodesulfobacteriota bacterium]|nr:hypothetical protein [Thermodesulfobacteriota bacterium]